MWRRRATDDPNEEAGYGRPNTAPGTSASASGSLTTAFWPAHTLAAPSGISQLPAPADARFLVVLALPNGPEDPFPLDFFLQPPECFLQRFIFPNFNNRHLASSGVRM